MNKEKNTPPLILILLVLLALLVIITYFVKAGNWSAQKKAASTGEIVTANPLTSDVVEWHAPALLPLINIFDYSENEGFKENKSTYSLVGKVTKGTYAGSDVILYALSGDDFNGPGSPPSFYRFIRTSDNKWILISSNSASFNSEIPHAKFTVDDKYSLPGLAFPEYLTLNDGTILAYEPYSQALFPTATSSLKKVFTDTTVGDVYSVPEENVFPTGSIFNLNGFYVRAPDGTTAVYALVAPFVNKNGATNITWSDGSKNTSDYTLSKRTGCGSVNFASVVYGINQSDLVQVGTASNGNAIYALKDTNNLILKKAYETYASYKGISYGDFLSRHPIIFWYDPLSRLLELDNTEFIAQAECGKPVIYLYPETTTKVNVKVKPQGGLSYTEPLYNENTGWNVIAKPDGTLTNLDDHNKVSTYPYLFWEGRGGIYKTPEKGFVIKENDVHTFLVEKLGELGLNKKESADFIEFWEPKMKGSPYYFVTFLDTKDMNIIAPLTITPKPDTVVRILMDFKPLDKPIAVEGYTITTPVRKGFTVIEWGGVLQ